MTPTRSARFLGGRLMHWIDLAGALAAHRHSHSYAVTASMDHIDFLVPVHVGDMVILQSAVNRAFHTSMEVGVRVLVENYISASRQKVATAYLTFVAVDRHGRRLQVPPVIPETEEEKRRYEGALRRRESAKAERERRGMARGAQDDMRTLCATAVCLLGLLSTFSLASSRKKANRRQLRSPEH